MLKVIGEKFKHARQKLLGRSQPITEIESRFWGNYPADKIIDGTILLDLFTRLDAPVAILGLSQEEYQKANWISVWGSPDKDPVVFDDRPKWQLVGRVVPHMPAPKKMSAWELRLAEYNRPRAQ